MSQPLLHDVEDLRQCQSDDQVEDRYRRIDLDGVEVVGCDEAALEDELGDEDDRQQRGVLDADDELVAQRRNHPLERLRPDDIAHRQVLREPQRPAGLHLPLLHRLHRTADDLGDVGTGVQADDDDAGGQRWDVEADDERQGEVDPDRLHQHRSAAQQLDIGRRDPVDDLAAGDAAEAEDRSEDEADDEPDDGDEQRVVKPLQQCGDVVDDSEPVELG